jgi:hypothetical protein
MWFGRCGFQVASTFWKYLTYSTWCQHIKFRHFVGYENECPPTSSQQPCQQAEYQVASTRGRLGYVIGTVVSFCSSAVWNGVCCVSDFRHSLTACSFIECDCKVTTSSNWIIIIINHLICFSMFRVWCLWLEMTQAAAIRLFGFARTSIQIGVLAILSKRWGTSNNEHWLTQRTQQVANTLTFQIRLDFYK